MCGITGFWQTKRGDEHALETLQRMGSALTHRGPDDSGTFHDTSASLGFAFRRLSILDLSSSGHQPMFSASGRYAIVFNGEVYNFEEIRGELDKGTWRGHSDTEVMLEAIERWGLESAVGRFVGMFAFALWDRQEKKLCLVRDRLGIKPLYYGRVGSDFVFGSELKSIRQYPRFDGNVDRGALALYMRYNYVPAPHCIYMGLAKLPAGCILTLNAPDAPPALHQYWSAENLAIDGAQSQLELSDEAAIELVHDHLLNAVKLRMIADVPLGAFLSGGIDSTSVVALMQAQSDRPIKTFTIGSREDWCNEAAHAKTIAAHLGTDHTELYVTGKDALEVVPLLSAMYDEPFSDSSQIPTYLVSKLARGSVTVALSGDGGDEVFGGYNRYLLLGRLLKSLRKIPRPVRGRLAALIHTIPPAGIDRLAKMLRPVLSDQPAAGDKAHKLADFFTSASQEELYLRALSHWQDPTGVVLNSFEPETVSASVGKLSRRASSFEAMMMLADLVHYLPDDILTKVDRASMSVGLEARVPLLDHRVVELSWRLPKHLKIRNGMSKWILRQILGKYVPAALIERPKMGFGVPIHLWLRGPLRDWAESLLAESNLRQAGFFDVAMVRDKWNEHLRGNRNWQYLLWDVLIFQEWFRSSTVETSRVTALNNIT